MRLQNAFGAGAITLAFVVTQRVGARAQVAPNRTPRLVLEWNGPARCPDKATVLADVEGLLAHSGADAGDRVYANGDIAASASGYRLRLDVDGARRELEGASCESLARAAALLIALVLNPQLQVTSEPPQSEGTSPSTPPPLPRAPPASGSAPPRGAVTPAAAATARPQPSSADQIWWYVAGPVLDVGTFPSLAVFGAFGGAWEHSSFRVAARLALAAPIHWEVGSNSRVAFQAFGFGARACLASPTGWLRPGLCAGLEGLRVDARGDGLSEPTGGGAWALAADGTVDLRVRVWDAWFLAAEASLVEPLIGLHFFVDGGADHRSGTALRVGIFATRVFQAF